MEATTGNRDMAKGTNLKHSEEDEQEEQEEGKSLQTARTCLSGSKCTRPL